MPECSVLIVDDDPTILAMLVEILELEGYPTHTATNGMEALLEVERCCPAVVLLDMRLPLVDGWAFAREIQARSIVLRIVVMTAAQDARAWAAEIHADGYLPKPFELTQLLTEVERLCKAAA